MPLYPLLPFFILGTGCLFQALLCFLYIVALVRHACETLMHDQCVHYDHHWIPNENSLKIHFFPQDKSTHCKRESPVLISRADKNPQWRGALTPRALCWEGGRGVGVWNCQSRRHWEEEVEFKASTSPPGSVVIRRQMTSAPEHVFILLLEAANKLSQCFCGNTVRVFPPLSVALEQGE